MDLLKGFGNILLGALRLLLWIVTMFSLKIADILYSVVKSIATFNILDDSNIWSYFTVYISAFLSLFIIIKLSKRYLKTLVDEQEADNFRWDKVILKIATIAFIVTLAPFMLKTFGNLLSGAVDRIESVFGIDDPKFSHFVLELSNIPKGMWDNLMSVEINKKASSTEYVYINDISDLLLIAIISFVSIFLLFIISIQIAGRILSIIMKLIISPYSFSSVIDENNDSLQKWWQLFIADFLSTYMQMLLLIVGTTILLGLDFKTPSSFTSALTKCVAVIGGLFGVLNAPSGVSQLIGGDIGISSTLQSLQTTMMASNIVKPVLSAGANVATFGAAAATYVAGRAAGGDSMKNIMAKSSDNGGSRLSGIISNIGGLGSGSGGGVASGEGGNNNAQLDLTMSSGQRDMSLMSARGGSTGLPNFSGTRGLNTLKTAVTDTNISKMVNNYSHGTSKGSNIASRALNAAPRMVARGVGWGASKMYSASMNRLQGGVMKHKPQNKSFSRNAAMYNFGRNNNIGGRP